jgi:hypothetical protein
MLLLLLSTQQLLLMMMMMMMMVLMRMMIFTIDNVRHWSRNSEGTPLCWLQSDQWWSFYRGSYEVISRGKHNQS